MEATHLINFIQNYGYWVLYPLMVVEGPIITLIGGGLAALGILQVEIVFLLSILGDLTMDISLYYFGLHGNQRLLEWINKHQKWKKRQKLISSFFKKHGGKVIFFVKISSGLCYITFITAGMIKMPLKKFLFFSLVGGIIWSGLLVSLGYFYGHLYQQISDKIEQAGILIFSLAIISFIFIILAKKWETTKLINR